MKAIAAAASSLLAASALTSCMTTTPETACAALAEPGRFADTTVTSAQMTPASTGAETTPAYCEVTGVISPVDGSAIGVVYRLPEDWNGKVLGLGGGGLSGDTSLRAAADPLARGYATMQTDTGHPISPTGDVFEASWIVDEHGEFAWEPLTDFAYRGLHLMTVVGKEVAAAHYGAPPARSYYYGCSTGGRQGLLEAQRFPADYDGVVAGAPIVNNTVQTSGFLRDRLFSERPSRRLAPEHLALVGDAVMAACDGDDGVIDGVITDPVACAWDPAALVCDGDAGPSCLTEDQAEAVRRLHADHLLETGEVAAYGLMPGSERDWRFAVDGPADPGLARPELMALFLGGFDVDPDALSAEELVAQVDGTDFAPLYEADDPDLEAFIDGGGKLIVWHGLLDTVANPGASVDYYEAAAETTGPAVEGAFDDHVRLFLMPGTAHCGGGPGANTADYLAALEAWVEDGDAPDAVLARHTPSPFGPPAPEVPEMERPVCAYPAKPVHQGGDPNAAASFRCE